MDSSNERIRDRVLGYGVFHTFGDFLVAGKVVPKTHCPKLNFEQSPRIENSPVPGIRFLPRCPNHCPNPSVYPLGVHWVLGSDWAGLKSRYGWVSAQMPKTQFWAVLGTSFPTIISIYFRGCRTNKKPPVRATGG